MFSVGFCLPHQPNELMSLPLLLGLSSVEVLRNLGFAEVGLKWPNDLMMSDKKCGGLLVEANTNRTPNHTWFVAGLGINTTAPPLLEGERSVACLAESSMGWHMSAQTVAKQLVTAWMNEWQRDWRNKASTNIPLRFKQLATWQGQSVTALVAGKPVQGTLMGINDEGALILCDAQQQHTITSGEVSRVRLATD